jgi:hypothetical protein
MLANGMKNCPGSQLFPWVIVDAGRLEARIVKPVFRQILPLKNPDAFG